jgi:hypothetical protein
MTMHFSLFISSPPPRFPSHQKQPNPFPLYPLPWIEKSGIKFKVQCIWFLELHLIKRCFTFTFYIFNLLQFSAITPPFPFQGAALRRRYQESHFTFSISYHLQSNPHTPSRAPHCVAGIKSHFPSLTHQRFQISLGYAGPPFPFCPLYSNAFHFFV